MLSRVRRSWIRALAVAGGLIFAATLSFLVWIDSRADHAWAALEKEVLGLMAEAPSRGGPRPTCRPDPEPGDAWIEYARAVKEIRRMDQGDRFSLIHMLEPGDAYRNNDLAERVLPAIEALQRGARKAEAHYPHDWTPAREWRDGKGIGAELALGLAALCRGRSLRDSGQDARALDLILDVLQFGRDSAHNGFAEGEGLSIIDVACGELRSMTAAMVRSDPVAERISRALKAMDEGFPAEGLSALNLAAALTHGRLRGLAWSDLLGAVKLDVERWPGIRFGCSSRLREADALSRLLTIARGYVANPARTWDETQSWEARERELRHANDWTSVMRMPPPDLRRRTLARIRLLRMALAQIAPLPDPFGTSPLRCEDRANARVFWSVGPDGVDDHGTGGWTGGKDLVLEIAR